jgi:hypothetical protein
VVDKALGVGLGVAKGGVFFGRVVADATVGEQLVQLGVGHHDGNRRTYLGDDGRVVETVILK